MTTRENLRLKRGDDFLHVGMPFWLMCNVVIEIFPFNQSNASAKLCCDVVYTRYHKTRVAFNDVKRGVICLVAHVVINEMQSLKTCVQRRVFTG